MTFGDGSSVQLTAELVVGAGLGPGVELPAARLAALRGEDQRLRAQAAAMRLLGYRARSAAELRRALHDRGFGPAAVEAAIGRLASAGLVDDRAFAARFVEVRSSQHRSRRLLARDLAAKGVDREVASAAVEEVDDALAAEAAARGRLSALRGLGRDAFYRKLGAFLQRRGFGYGTAGPIVERLWREVSTEQDQLSADTDAPSFS